MNSNWLVDYFGAIYCLLNLWNISKNVKIVLFYEEKEDYFIIGQENPTIAYDYGYNLSKTYF